MGVAQGVSNNSPMSDAISAAAAASKIAAARAANFSQADSTAAMRLKSVEMADSVKLKQAVAHAVEAQAAYRMEELVVDEARAELAPTQADVAASLQHAQNKATALVQAATTEERTANRRAEDSLRSAKLAIAAAKRKARMKIEQELATEIQKIKGEREQVEHKAQLEMDNISPQLSGPQIFKEEQAIRDAQKKVLDEIDARATRARELAQDAQDRFCNRLDQHETALKRVAQLTATKMSGRLSHTKKKAALLVHQTQEQGKTELLKASQNLDAEQSKKRSMADAADAAEENLHRLQRELQSMKNSLTHNATAAVAPARLKMEKSLRKAKMLAKKMMRMQQRQEERVTAVQDEIEQSEHTMSSMEMSL